MTLDELTTLYTLMCEQDFMLSGVATRREAQFVDAFLPEISRSDSAGGFFAYLRVQLRPDIWAKDSARCKSAAEFAARWERREQ